MLEFLSQAATEAKTVPEFKTALHLPEKVIDSAAKDLRKRLHPCVSASGLYKYSDKGTKIEMWEYVWAAIKIIFSYIGSPRVKISQKVLGGYFF